MFSQKVECFSLYIVTYVRITLYLWLAGYKQIFHVDLQTFKYLAAVLSQTDKFSEREKIILAKYAMKIALDHNCQPILNALKDLIVVCINSIKEWNQFKVIFLELRTGMFFCFLFWVN